ncbi:MAG: lactate racemase domain-containing protein, partial [Sedimentibacter sp.]
MYILKDDEGMMAMSIVNDMLESIEIPRFARITQHFETIRIDDVMSVVDEQFRDDNIKNRIKPGQRIGITVGSRGIANLKEIVRAVSRNIKELGAQPIIISSMGSHGGATAQGQREVIEELGVTEEYTGAKIMSSMEVVQIGVTDTGIPVYYDKIASELDGMVLMNRIKAHTDINGDIESGLHKIIAIGLGNHVGATAVHSKGMENASSRIKSVGKVVLENANIIFGIALLEN